MACCLSDEAWVYVKWDLAHALSHPMRQMPRKAGNVFVYNFKIMYVHYTHL